MRIRSLSISSNPEAGTHSKPTITSLLLTRPLQAPPSSTTFTPTPTFTPIDTPTARPTTASSPILSPQPSPPLFRWYTDLESYAAAAAAPRRSSEGSIPARSEALRDARLGSRLRWTGSFDEDASARDADAEPGLWDRRPSSALTAIRHGAGDDKAGPAILWQPGLMAQTPGPKAPPANPATTHTTVVATGISPSWPCLPVGTEGQQPSTAQLVRTATGVYEVVWEEYSGAATPGRSDSGTGSEPRSDGGREPVLAAVLERVNTKLWEWAWANAARNGSEEGPAGGRVRGRQFRSLFEPSLEEGEVPLGSVVTSAFGSPPPASVSSAQTEEDEEEEDGPAAEVVKPGIQVSVSWHGPGLISPPALAREESEASEAGPFFHDITDSVTLLHRTLDRPPSLPQNMWGSRVVRDSIALAKRRIRNRPHKGSNAAELGLEGVGVVSPRGEVLDLKGGGREVRGRGVVGALLGGREGVGVEY
ncbi:hypothetical protein EJ06DRAFT_558291 [Trichodelitschia bisporula]|uniref:Uncharacterized protein n=1 Tax=Trichodelitschia bisporula TaxID=703511 RepID=A0A6G1HQX3_9PEZI|nr:hypothetical protein EJ06DRAFT_558291 [Trichodelitschia bisporula]